MAPRSLGFALMLAVLGRVGPAIADESPSAERINAAAEEFDRGRRAYLAKDFEQAAGHFENAYRDAPSKETLRLAIRARRDARQPARAATLAAVAQEKYAADPTTTQLAQATLDATARELSEYIVECGKPCTVAAGGRVVSQADALRHRIFLEPGGQDLGVSFANLGSVSRHVEGKRGATSSLAFEPPPPPVVSTPAAAPVPKTVPPGSPTPRDVRPFSPFVFVVFAGLTVAAGAATVVSGIATQNDPGPDAVRRACAGQSESCPLYQEGQDAELRTNVLVGTTIGIAVVTAAVGLFFTRWSTTRRLSWSVRPAALGGRF